MRKLLAVFAAALLATAFAQVEIEVWHSLSENYGAPQFEAFAEEFNAMQDDIKVVVSYSGEYTETLRKSQAAAAAGRAPSLVMFEQTRGAGFVDAGAVVPIDRFIEADPGFAFDDLTQSLLGACRIDGQLWCLPYNPSTPLIYYNKDLFREVGLDPEADFPTTWDELMEIAPKFAVENANGELERWGFGLAHAPGWLFDAWLGQAGGRYLNDDGSAFVFNGEQGVAMLEYWLALVEAKGARPSGSQTPDFFGGKQAMMAGSTATLRSNFERADFDIGAAPMWCGEECYVPFGGANFYIMADANAEQQQAAFEYLKWLTSTEKGAEFAAATGYMAPRRSSLDTATLQAVFEELPEARITYEQAESHGYPRTLVPFWGEVHNQLTLVTERVLLNGEAPQVALDEAVEEANRLLEVYAD